MATAEDIVRGTRKLKQEDIDQLAEIVRFMIDRHQKSPSKQATKVDADLIAVIADALKSDLEPISLRAKTIIKHMNAGHFNNRKICHLAAAILEFAEKCDASIRAIEGVATSQREGAYRCKCDITDLWNGIGCTCGGR